MNNQTFRTWVAITVALVVIAAVFFRGNIINWFQGTNTSVTEQTAPSDEDVASAIVEMSQGELVFADVTVGQGAEAMSGQEVSVHYVGLLSNGTKFDSSRDRGTPFTFVLGSGQVIPGFDKAVTGMKVGGIRRVVIPPAEGYGSQAVGSIPPESTLLFELELLEVK